MAAAAGASDEEDDVPGELGPGGNAGMELAEDELTLVGDEFLGDDAGGVVFPDGIDELVWGREVLKV